VAALSTDKRVYIMSVEGLNKVGLHDFNSRQLILV
jgi:hypothetical protein